VIVPEDVELSDDDSVTLHESLNEPDSSSVGVSEIETDLDAANVSVGDGINESVNV